MGRPKTYIIRLKEEERAILQKTIRNKETCKTVLKRCQILLELDEEQGSGLTHAQLAHSYAVCSATITNIIQSYVTNGIRDIIRYNYNPKSSAALRKVDGRAEAHISRWLADRRRKVIPAGRSVSLKRKPALNWKFRWVGKRSAGR